MMAQKATDLRRLRAEVEADQAALRARQQELEVLLAAAPAKNWAEASRRRATFSISFLKRRTAMTVTAAR